MNCGPVFPGSGRIIEGQSLYHDVDFVIMAAGSGTRMQQSIKKQWMPIAKKPLFLYTVLRFLSFGADSIIVVVHPDDVLATRETLRKDGVSLSLFQVVTGGFDRQESVFYGLCASSRPLVAVHDAARPFVMENDVLSVVTEARRSGAATLGYPVRDTLIAVEQTTMTHTLARDGIWQVQTPQVFFRDWLTMAHVKARQEGFHGTDDTTLLGRLGYAVHVVRGSAFNVKITEPGDELFIKLWEARECE